MLNNKGISSVGIATIVAVLILGGGYVYFSQNQSTMPVENNDSMVKDADVMTNESTTGDGIMNKGKDATMEKQEGGEIVNNSEDNMEKKDEVMDKSGSYEAYDAAKVTEAAKNGKAVLFFHAAWCPTCRSLNTNIESNLSKIPAGISIFKTNYDTENSLKQKYGVTYQHTMVQVDSSGNQIAKWSGSPTLADLVSKVK
ncbi:MAG: thioredoxin family protein [Anaplasmataceae bacterium]|nr:thioredoxin family protein [Anaplasmataceae bacterium]